MASNPLYQGAGAQGTNPLFGSDVQVNPLASEAEVINNPLYEGAGASGYNPLHRP